MSNRGNLIWASVAHVMEELRKLTAGSEGARSEAIARSCHHGRDQGRRCARAHRQRSPGGGQNLIRGGHCGPAGPRKSMQLMVETDLKETEGEGTVAAPQSPASVSHWASPAGILLTQEVGKCSLYGRPPSPCP